MLASPPTQSRGNTRRADPSSRVHRRAGGRTEPLFNQAEDQNLTAQGQNAVPR